MEDTLVMYVNGEEIKVSNPDPEMNLLTFLRNSLNMKGSKYGCGEGGCGACTVLLTKFQENSSTPKHISVNACLAPLCTMHGVAITTVEGLGSVHTEMHPVQKVLATSHGSQCGYCTPGFIMSMYTLLCNNPKPRVQDIENAFQGNLCRCTGYRPIIQGFSKFAVDDKKNLINEHDGSCYDDDDDGKIKNGEASTSGVSNGCVNHSVNNNCKNGENNLDTISECSRKYGIDLEKLNILKKTSPVLDEQFLCFKSNRVTWYRPTTLNDLLDLKVKYPKAKLLIGNTEIGIETRFKNIEYPVIIACTHVKELNNIDEDYDNDDENGDGGLWVGASVTLSTIETCLNEKLSTLPEFKTRMFAALMNMMKLFASPQIKNVGSLGGNIMTASPISDIIPVLVSARSKMLIQSKKKGCRQRILDKSFFTGYRQTSVDPDEIMLKICLPYSSRLEYYSSFKQSRRKDDDIAIVNAAMWVKFKNRNSILPNNGLKDGDINEDGEVVDLVVDDVILAFGGMGITVVVATKTMKSLINMKWDEELLNVGTKCLTEELFLDLGTPGGMEAYRSSLTVSFFFKFYIDICLQLQRDYPLMYATPFVTNENLSASDKLQEEHYHEPFFIQVYDDGSQNKEPPKPYHREAFTYDTDGQENGINNYDGAKTFQHHDEYSKTPSKNRLSIVGKPINHVAAFKHTTGEAVYVDDMPHYENELFLSLVVSSKAHANILSIDYSEALKCEGVVGVVGSEDIKGSHLYGKIVPDEEEVFWSKTVISQYQPILGILAHTKSQGRIAVLKVKVNYQELTPILSIQDAIAANSFIKPLPSFKTGDPLGVLNSCDHVIEGEVSLGGQEHFYMEPNACLVVPHEDGGAEVWSSIQHPDILQSAGASVLGVPTHKVMCRVPRMGGGFGGKENKSVIIALPSMVAANKFKRPVRSTLDRDEDMTMTAGRHPYMAKYKVGFTKEGKIVAYVIDLYANCGCTMDASDDVMTEATFKLDNMYSFKNVLVNRYLCKTNLPSNTAFRGFGAPQAHFITETIVERVAASLKVPSLQIRELNFYKEGDVTMYNQVYDCAANFEECWRLLKEQSNYYEQLKDIEEFNKKSRWIKKGICLTPMKYGIGFSAQFLNQGGALVNVYRDGSVLLAHGGTEMGQGLHTKMIQVAAEVLQISTSLIHIHDTNSHIIPNTSPTAASFSSDLYGMAVVLACEKLVKRLQPYMKSYPEDGWKGWVGRAYIDRVALSATGHYKKPYAVHNIETNQGRMYNYYSIAAACSVVQIDCLTGANQILRTDIVMDVGKSLNPAIDVGQIEGAFMQGYGLYTMEDLKYSSDGRMLTTGPGAYKIPSICDTPRVFNVTLLKNSPNIRAVYSSKAIGEPPLLLADSVVGAIRNAIQSARRDAGLKDADWFDLNAPVTCERIRMACTDQFTQLYKRDKGQNHKPWFKEIV